MIAFGTQEVVAIGGTIVFNSIAQILLRIGLRDSDIAGIAGEREYSAVFQALLNPPVVAGVASMVIGGVFWMVAISKLPASIAYPMISIGYIVVTLLSWLFLSEQIGWQKLLGAAVIIMGVAVIAKSA